MKKNSSWAVGLKAAAWKSSAAPVLVDGQKGKTLSKTVLVGAHFLPEVRRTLTMIQTEPQNFGKTMKQLPGRGHQ